VDAIPQQIAVIRYSAHVKGTNSVVEQAVLFGGCAAKTIKQSRPSENIAHER
jgi:hypothetical protein